MAGRGGTGDVVVGCCSGWVVEGSGGRGGGGGNGASSSAKV